MVGHAEALCEGRDLSRRHFLWIRQHPPFPCKFSNQESARAHKLQGLAADELFSQLEEAEFAQSGGLLPMASQPAANSASAEGAGECQPLPAPAPAHEITQKLLSSWISLSYMTLAQLHVPYPAAAERVGWAWAG